MTAREANTSSSWSGNGKKGGGRYRSTFLVLPSDRWKMVQSKMLVGSPAPNWALGVAGSSRFSF